ncbi:HEAT repeat domain-containing protein [Tellurirhabdus bombi]|uniref:HEAT repeat domain-containing protein n=1 Tax=Tellurirhabdus bombi TaxID=2907205 RepID=UPI001F1EFEAB|nr:HEAT repeat domain-containing protein [Tellurirhabdus bombi]
MKQDIEKLLEKYYEGETTVDEEKQLRTFFQQEVIPSHLQSHAAQFQYFASAQAEQPSTQTAEWLDQTAKPQTQIRRLTSWGLRLAASLILIAGGFMGGLLYNRQPVDQLAFSSENDVREITPEYAMKKALRFEEAATTSASERIQAVNQSYELNEANQEITQLLINTLNFDDNLNVRLAACQALLRFENEPGVREALIQSLKIQTDPNVQITLIEALVAMKEKRAVDEMQRLVQNQQVLEVVRLKAEEGLNHLSDSKHKNAS